MLSEEELIEARHKLAAGRILASRKMPYFTTALMAMSPHEREGLGTFAVDERWRMYYDPEKCLEWTVQEIAAVWLHEVGHVIRAHNERFRALEGYNHDPHLFNAAGDAAINSDLRESDVLLPNPELRYYAEPNSRFPKWKKGMTAEEMYFIGRGLGQGNPPPPEPDKTSSKSESSDSSDAEDENDDQSSENPIDPFGDLDDTSEESEGSDSETEDSSQDQNSSDSSDEDSGEQSTNENAEGDSDAGENEDSPESDDAAGNSDEEGAEGGDGSESETGSEKDESSEEGEGDSSSNEDGDESEGDSSDSSSSGNSGDTPGDSDPEGAGEGESGPPLPDCGSAVDGEPRDYEETDDNDGSVDKTAAEVLKKKTAEDIIEYAKSNPGSVPGNLVREAENILDPQVDWRDEFAALTRHVAASHAGYTNYSYNRPSRRSSGSNFILPTMRNPPAPEIAIVLDTSGSMDEKRELALGLAEMEDIINRSSRYSESQSIKIINCDSQAATVEVVRDLKDFQIIGGGGTDMRVGIKAASELKPRVDVVITVTDGFTPWPQAIPEENSRAVYIALIVGGEGHARSNSTRYSTVPEWMKVIEVNIPQKRKGYSVRH